MHESSICRSILERALEVCRREQAQAVEVIAVEVGVLSGCDAGHFTETFSRIAAGTAAARARIDVNIIPLRVHCPDCGSDNAVSADLLDCPRCGRADTRLIDGTDVRLERVGLCRTGAAQ